MSFQLLALIIGQFVLCDLIAQVFPIVGFDHWLVCLVWDGTGPPIRRPFRFEQFWLEHKDFKSLAHQWWEDMDTPRGTQMYQFQQKLKALKERIRTWNKEEFGHIF